jgi:ribosomal protein L30/L7E
MNHTVEVDMENPSVAGMVNKIKHLLKIEEI